MTYISEAHNEWHTVNGASAVCPLDCGAGEQQYDAEVALWDDLCPGWWLMEVDPEQRDLISENDFPVGEDTATDDEWAAFLEDVFSDPAEWADRL